MAESFILSTVILKKKRLNKKKRPQLFFLLFSEEVEFYMVYVLCTLRVINKNHAKQRYLQFLLYRRVGFITMCLDKLRLFSNFFCKIVDDIFGFDNERMFITNTTQMNRWTYLGAFRIWNWRRIYALYGDFEACFCA